MIHVQQEVSSFSYALWPLLLDAFFIAMVFLLKACCRWSATSSTGSCTRSRGNRMSTPLIEADNVGVRFGLVT